RADREISGATVRHDEYVPSAGWSRRCGAARGWLYHQRPISGTPVLALASRTSEGLATTVRAISRHRLERAYAPAPVLPAPGVGLASGLPAAAFTAAVVALLLGAWRLARTIGRLRLADDAVLATWTVAVAWLALVAEILSAGHWLGSRTGWTTGCLLLYLA